MQELSIEEKFKLEAFKVSVQGMSTDEIKCRLFDLYIKMLYCETEFKNQLGKKWGLM